MRPTLAAVGLCLAVGVAHGQTDSRGKYIVERVGMCADCHTPRNEKGQLLQSEALKGAPIGFRPMHQMPFAEQAPRIAGLPANWTVADTVRFMETGRRPDGSSPLPPMPSYRLSHEDALSVVEYLKTMKP